MKKFFTNNIKTIAIISMVVAVVAIIAYVNKSKELTKTDPPKTDPPKADPPKLHTTEETTGRNN